MGNKQQSSVLLTHTSTPNSFLCWLSPPYFLLHPHGQQSYSCSHLSLLLELNKCHFDAFAEIPKYLCLSWEDSLKLAQSSTHFELCCTFAPSEHFSHPKQHDEPWPHTPTWKPSARHVFLSPTHGHDSQAALHIKLVMLWIGVISPHPLEQTSLWLFLLVCTNNPICCGNRAIYKEVG